MKVIKIIFYYSAVLFLMASSGHAQELEMSEEYQQAISWLGSDDKNETLDYNASEVLSFNSCLGSPVTVALKNSPLSEGLQKIARQTGIRLLYKDRLVDNSTVSLEANNEPLGKVLKLMLAGNGIGYKEFRRGQIVLYKARPAAEKYGSIKGTIKDEKGEVLPGANIVIAGSALGASTDANGKYTILKIKPGSYTVRASFISYETAEKNVTVEEGKAIDVSFSLRPTAFQIGGIEVVGVTDLLPTDVASKTTITSGEIEHFQASSVKDVLDLVPGVQKSDNPGLGKAGQIAIRGAEDDRLSALGTLIMVDGIPVSNNANLQFEKAGGATLGYSNMGGGVDLRTIPADNLNSIEIITGLPSVRYGDATEGVINIKTKIGNQPHRLKIKQNPDTQEANLGGGFALGKDGISYNLNYARSERDIRLTGDEYSRLTGQIVYSSSFFDNSFIMNQKITGQKIFDDEEPKGDVYQTRNYNHSFSLGYANWGKYSSDGEVSSVDYNFYINHRNENSMKSKLVQSDLWITPAGDTISAYIGRVETIGREWNLGGRLEWGNIFFTGDIVHKVLLGTDLQYNANTGDGVLVDSNYNYYGRSSGRRSYSFSDIPGQTIASLYAEDKLTWHYIFDFNLMLGLRYEMYRPFQFNFKGIWGDGDLVSSHQSSFFNPRLNLMIYFSKNNQLRLSAGTTSKSPAMSTIYAQPDVFKWRDPVAGRNLNFTYDMRVPDLKGHRETQLEFAYDHRFFNFLGTTVSAYYKERNNEGVSQQVPVFFTTTVNSHKIAYYIDSYNLPQNIGKTFTRGFEFTLRTNKVKPLNMNFEVNGSYNFTNAPRSGIAYDFTPDASLGQHADTKFPQAQVDSLMAFAYTPESKWSDRFQLNYYIRYTLPPLGLWITLRAEHLVFERYQYYNREPEDYSILTPDGKIAYDFNREIKLKNVKWLFNLNISKSLFKGAEVSFYVNNFLDDPAMRRYFSSPTIITEEQRNPSLFYGIEFSASVDDLFRRGGE